MATSYGLQGRVVVITGAASGIGRGLALAFARQDVELVLLDRSTDALQTVAAELRALAPSPSHVSAYACDLSDDEAVRETVAQLRADHPQVHVLVNNAGVEYPTPLSDTASDANARWARLLDNNVTSMARLTRALLPTFAPGASIINQASIWGKTGVADFSAYVASKHAVIGLTRALAWELGPRGIRVNAVCPGWIRTDAAMASLRSMAQTQGRSEAEVEREILAGQALPGMLTPADIAGVYLFLASDDARCMTGQSLVASNGEVMA
jgi:NAD(P)-dependent dehydrogenase (short-subunit alcohol dehydrogenase family)